MTTTRRFPRLALLLGAAALAFAATGCGDDDDGFDCGTGTVEVNGVCVPIDYDASPVDSPDAEPVGDPDAEPPVADTRGGFIALVDLEVLGSGFTGTTPVEAKNFSGATVLVNYDVEPPDPLPAYSSLDAIGQGCYITMYDHDAGINGLPETDEGAVTFGGTSLNVQIGTCTYQESTKDYACINGAGYGSGGAAVSFTTTVGYPMYTFNSHLLGGAFTNTHLGMVVKVSGAQNDAFDGTYPIVAVLSGNTIAVGNPNWEAADLATPGLTTAQYALIAGNPSPLKIPTFQNTLTGTSLTVHKVASDEVDEIDTEVTPGGKGFVLRTDGDYVTPTTVTDLTAPLKFGCTGEGCGTTALAMAVFGSATTEDVSGLLPFKMPEGQMSGNSVGFGCFQLGATEIELEQELMDVLASINPTRVEFQVVRVNLSQVGNAEPPGNGTNVAAGFGVVGHSNRPAGGWAD